MHRGDDKNTCWSVGTAEDYSYSFETILEHYHSAERITLNFSAVFSKLDDVTEIPDTIPSFVHRPRHGSTDHYAVIVRLRER